MKDELEKLKNEVKTKNEELLRARAAYAKQEQANYAASIAAETGGTVEEKKRYIGALEEAKIRRQNNLSALEQSVANYKVNQVFSHQRKISI